MNAEQLRNAIWKIDDKFIAEAETYEPETRSIKPVYIIAPASAAVIALCTCLHFHNSVNQMLDPEIDNGVIVTDTVTETESCETDASITEIQTETSYSAETGSAVMNTETSYTESGYESSTPYAVTVPAKTETPSGGSSSVEKTVITQGRSEITLQPVTEETDVQTIVPVTEPVVTVPADTEKVTTENAGEFPTPTLWPTVEPTRPPTVEPTIAPTRWPTVNPTQIPTTDPTRLPTVEPTMVRPTDEPTLPPTVSPTDSTVCPTIAPQWLYGDVNTDGVIDVSDFTMLSLALVGDVELSERQKVNADVDNDSEISVADLASLRQYLSKKITSF
ncbi:dockerin type I domain-containing protein [Ruminococcus sp. HUN007]|uniref:dockerin type I domain-containing protein n=1 Tax=Ruminococcus sp. HUN007 TaxID=1514668 RepID=UPI0005D22055|nr:dockerin type I domain-containing protein [Ruminococcus sp. HUN007]